MGITEGATFSTPQRRSISSVASMFDTIADMLRGSAPDDLAHALGTDRTQTRRAMEIGLPALITGLRDKTLEPGGAQNLSAMLENTDASLPDDIPAYLSEGDPSRGAAMLDVAFGDRGEPALASLADASGLSTRLLAQVMSVLAPIATGVLRDDAPGDADGLRAFLGSSVEDLEGKGFGRVVELVSPDLINAGPAAEPVVEVVDTAGPAELDVVVDDFDESATVVQGAFPEPDDLDVQLSSIPEPRFDSGLDAQVGSVPIMAADGALGAGGDVVSFGAGETPVVEPNVDFDEGGGLSAMGWLWWLIGAILAVLVLLFLISQCGDDAGDGVATDTDPTAVPAQPTPDPLVIQRQATLDGILVDYPGVTGEVVGEVAVLDGTVADLRTKALLDGAVRAASLGVQNNVNVDESAAPVVEGFSLNDLIDAQPELSTLRRLLDQAGLGEALDGNGPFTLFAPTNDAFAAIQNDLAAVEGDPAVLSAYLQYHLLSGEQTGAAISQQQTLTSLTGELIDVSVESGAVRLNDFVPVLVADAEARNGVMHVVSGVLTPPSQVPVPAELGSALELNPITFAAGSASLADSSLVELDKVVAFLLETPVDVEIGGHTDSDGGEDGNLTLSQQRADAVKQYLTDQGVPAETLTAVGFGEASPVAPNDTAANKALNRRIEFVTG